MAGDEDAYWFPAKRYGWGWGLPKRWQGWLVLVIYALLLAWAAASFLPIDDKIAFVATAFALTAALVLVCWWKGEPLRWRWGDDPDHRDAHRR
jgi:hypothetical protein